LDALKELEAAQNYMCQFGAEHSIIVKCTRIENELYRLRAQDKKKQITFIEWLKK
jgi:hypothetical protein